MFNIMLDPYPDEWEGYKINTDFRIGIQITQASEDPELSKLEKVRVMTMLLFIDEYPDDITECMRAIEWFLSAWSHDNFSEPSGKKSMDFDIDQGRIYSAFLHQYRIDLNTEDMHFWRFMILLSTLEECSFTRVVDIRQKEINSKMSKAELKGIIDAKRVYKLELEEDKETKDAIEEVTNKFLNALGKE